MNIRPRHQPFNRQTQSVHYVNAYAVPDRLNFLELDETITAPIDLSTDELLPTKSDHDAMLDNFVVLAGRILWESIPSLKRIPNIATDHIKHAHYKEMSSKSQTVNIIMRLKMTPLFFF